MRLAAPRSLILSTLIAALPAFAGKIRAALDAEAFHGQSMIDRAGDLVVEAGELTR